MDGKKTNLFSFSCSTKSPQNRAGINIESFFLEELIGSKTDGLQDCIFSSQSPFSIPLAGQNPNLMCNIKNLDINSLTFILVEICPAVQGIDCDLFTVISSKNDKWHLRISFADHLQKFDSIHFRHRIIRNDCICLVLIQINKSIPGRNRCIH